MGEPGRSTTTPRALLVLLTVVGVGGLNDRRELRASCFEFELKDVLGGWDGAVYTIARTDGAVAATGTLDDGLKQQTQEVCLGEGCYSLSVSTGQHPNEVSWTFASFSGGAPFPATWFAVTSSGNITQCRWSCDDPSVRILGGDGTYELREVGTDGVVAAATSEDPVNDTVCVPHPGNCHLFTVRGGSAWYLDDLLIRTDESYVTIRDDGVVEGCDDALVGVCKGTLKSSDIDPVRVGIECTDFEHVVENVSCVCLGAANCQSCPPGTSYAGSIPDDDGIFRRRATNITADIDDHDAVVIVKKVVGDVESETILVPQKTALRVQGDRGSSLSGKKQRRIFIVEATAILDVLNLTLKHGRGDDYGGGCLVVGRTAVVRLTDVVLLDCASNYGGAAIMFQGSTLTAAGLTVTNGRALKQGGGLYAADFVNVEIFEARIDNCTATDGGFLFLQGTRLALDLARIEASTASHDGGAIYSRGDVNVTKSSISNCVAGRAGGAVASFGTSLELGDVRIDKCSANNGGGAVFAWRDASVIVKNLEINRCFSSYGGGIFLEQRSALSLEDSRIRRCTATYGGAINANPKVVLKMRRSEILESTVYLAGAAIFADDEAIIDIIDSRFVGNFAGFGGAIYGEPNTTIALRTSEITNCSARFGYGGAVYGNDDAVVDIRDSTITNCWAATNGGAVAGDVTVLEVQGTTIQGCSAIYGGGLFGDVATIRVRDSEIIDSSATSGGGIFGDVGSSITVNGTTIRDCTATLDGGGLSGETGIFFSNSVISQSWAGDNGGGLYGGDDSTITLVNATVHNCTSSGDGGGIFVNDRSKILVTEGSLIDGCRTALSGGGLYGQTGSQITVQRAIISRNDALKNGGGLSLGQADAILKRGCQILGNSAAQNGGGIFVDLLGHIFLLGKVLVEGNDAEKGGGIYARGDNDTPETPYVLGSRDCIWVQLTLDFSNGDVDWVLVAIYSETTQSHRDDRGRSTLVVPTARSLRTSFFCLGPGNYEFSGYSTTSFGWDLGTATLAFPSSSRNDLKCAVLVGKHACTRKFSIAPVDESGPVFRLNRASNGGALAVNNKARAFLDGVRFEANTAISVTKGGGAILAEGFSVVDVTRTEFRNNSALRAVGGALCARLLSTVTVQGCVAKSNAASSGGFAYLSESREVATISETRISNNSAVEGSGGGLFATGFEEASFLDVINVTFFRNIATSFGAGCAIEDAPATLNRVLFEQNEGRGGGALAILPGAGAAFVDTSDCVDIEIQIDLRNTPTCDVVQRGFTCDGFETCGLIIETLGPTVCTGCACFTSQERGVKIEGGSYVATATGYAGGIKTSSYCLPRPSSSSDFTEYTVYAFDELGRSFDGAEWSLVVAPNKMEDVQGFTDVVTTATGVHYVGAQVEGNVSRAATFRVPGIRPKKSMMRGNRARGGGGAIFIDGGVGNGDIRPLGLNTTVRFEKNIASYGVNVGTPPRTVELLRAARRTKSGQAADEPLAVALRDGENQTAVIQDETAAVRIVVDSTVSLSGSTIVPFLDGVATFTDLRITKTPGSNVSVIVSTSLTTLETASLHEVINLDDCVPGEAKSETLCTPCLPGEYSFDPQEPCRDCPKHARCPGLNSVIPGTGYWKSGAESTNIRRCPFRKACSHYTDLLAGNVTLHPNAQCAGKHKGPLCAVCKNNSVLSTGVCRRCRTILRDTVIAFAVIFGVLILAMLALAFYIRDSKLKAAFSTRVHVAGNLLISQEDAIQSTLKIMIVFYDITSKLSQFYPTIHVPPAFEDMSAIVAIFGLDLSSYLRRACFVSFDHIDLLYGATFIPLGLLGSLVFYVWYRLPSLDEEAKTRLISRTSYFGLLFTYVILTTTSRIVVRSLVCDTDFDDSSEKNSIFYKDAYLYVDYSVSCQTQRWHISRVYATLMLFCYPIGIPMLYFVSLFRIKDIIAPTNVNAVAEKTLRQAPAIMKHYDTSVAAGKADIALWKQTPQTQKTSFIVTSLELRLRIDQHSADSWRKANHLAALYKHLITATSSSSPEDDDEDDEAKVSPPLEAIVDADTDEARLTRLGERLVLETRFLDSAVWPYTFLFDEYRTTCWFWPVPTSILNFETTSFLSSESRLGRSRSCDHSCQGKMEFFLIFWFSDFFSIEFLFKIMKLPSLIPRRRTTLISAQVLGGLRVDPAHLINLYLTLSRDRRRLVFTVPPRHLVDPRLLSLLRVQ